MNICINAGHTLKGKGSGALGWLNESEETRNVVKHLIPLLRAKGHNVTEATIDKSNNYLEYVVTKANSSKVDLFLSVHFNAGHGRGTECYTWKGNKVSAAVKICENLHKLGFENRGIKDGSGFYVIRKTEMTAIIVEVCFIDTLGDVALYKNHGSRDIAIAISESV